MFYTLIKHRFLTNQSAHSVLSVMNSDKTWVFDQSERVQGPIYIINTHKYGHGEMRNKKLINRRNDIYTLFIIALEKEGEKKKSSYNMGYSYLVTHPSTIPAKQGLTLLSERNMLLSLLYSDSAVNAFF